MHDDPTRRMEPPERRPPSDREAAGARAHYEQERGLSNRLKLVLAVLVAAVLGMGVALAVIATDSGGDEVVTETVTEEGEQTTVTQTAEPVTTTATQVETETTTETTTTTVEQGP